MVGIIGCGGLQAFDEGGFPIVVSNNALTTNVQFVEPFTVNTNSMSTNVIIGVS